MPCSKFGQIQSQPAVTANATLQQPTQQARLEQLSINQQVATQKVWADANEIHLSRDTLQVHRIMSKHVFVKGVSEN